MEKYLQLGLNMFLVPQVSVKFEISPSSKFLTNLVIHLSKCVNLVLLTKFCKVYLTFQTHFMIVFILFILFDTFLL